jgi:hypothetical protein
MSIGLFFSVLVILMYSGEYDVCDVTLSVYPHRASLKYMSGHGGWCPVNRDQKSSHTSAHGRKENESH